MKERTGHESLVIRPPSEARSLLVRLTRGCRWNRCRFCGLYPALGEPGFSMRSADEVKRDIDQMRGRVERMTTAFFGDADPLQAGVGTFVDVAGHLRSVFPEITRLTCYARASTLWKLGRAGLETLAGAGLDRVHMGLESGDAETLKYHRKGQSPAQVIETCGWLKDAGIEVSLYVLLGLGGAGRWREHADGTAAVISAADPDFVRVRRLWLYTSADTGGPESPLAEEVRAGRFVEQTAEGTVLELRRMLGALAPSLHGWFTCDHSNNYMRVEGRIADDLPRMLAEVDAFLALPEAERQARYAAVGSTI